MKEEVKALRLVHGKEVFGVEVDEETRCGHWHSPLDIIAIRFKCCGRWYPCFDCHAEVAGHEPAVWPRAERAEKAILCGGCGVELSIDDYLACENLCPACECQFNPGCAKHYHLYFE
ncbi:MAG TPA: hypothetical protein DEP46_19645 [Blastocatellia bacterium]|nr:hypothetical protein [Blastocatellia bacterium]